MRRDEKSRGWWRHLDGWQAGAIVVVLAGSAVILGVPKAATPEVIPAPRIDGRALAEVMDADEQRALAAQRVQLDHDVRRVGQLFRHYNLAAAEGRETDVMDLRGELLNASRAALARSPEGLTQLRAYQMLRFIEVLHDWTRTGEETEELRALGGDFVTTLARNRWCREGSRELVLDDRELRVLYKKRWNDVTGLHGPSFDPTVDEDRVRYGFLLRHPYNAPDDARAAAARLEIVDRLAAVDPSYPAGIARGVVLYRLGRFTHASQALSAHLEAHPDGPYTLLATNYLKAALDMAVSE